MELDKAIHNRKSCRKFSTRKPDWRDIIECIDIMRHTPMAGKNFTLKFIFTDNKDAINKIAEASQQDFIKQVHYLVAVCSDNSRTVNSYGKMGEVYSRQQAGAAIQNFLLKVEEKGLATCWIGHFVEGQIKKELGIPGNINVEAVFPVGYEFKKEKPSRKINFDNVLYFEKYGNKKMKNPRKLDV